MLARRTFLRRTGAASLALPFFVRAAAPAEAAPNTILVAILQAGGCDGLSTVIPLKQYGLYSDNRHDPGAPQGLDVAVPLSALAATAFEANPATPASAAATYAFHPSMTALRALYAGGHVAVLTGVGVPPQENNRLSHEAGTFDWESGSINRLGYDVNGWLGLGFDNVPGGTLPALISLCGQAPTLMTGRNASPLVLAPQLESFALASSSPDPADASARLASFSEVQGQPGSGAAAEYARSVAASASGLIAQVQKTATSFPADDYPATTSFLSQQLKEIARVILANTGARAFYAVQGGYDTHGEQAPAHAALVGDLADSLTGFYGYLRRRGASANVAIMTYTDFGRRVKANNDHGTDHGTAAVNFIIGDPVRGGVYGEYPNLNALDSDGDMIVKVDFRSQISDVMTYLGIDARPILGQSYPRLGFL